MEISRKRRSNKTALAKVQIWLLEELVVAEAAARHYKDKKNELRDVLLHPDTSDKEKDRITNDLETIEREMFFHRAHANCIRSIGDGIAWRALGYDRAAIRLLCGRATKHTVLSEGAHIELFEWSRAFDSGDGLAIFNALTNCLAFGDITIVRDDGSVELVEVKKSKTKSRRITRQKQAMREVVEFLNFGRGEVNSEKIDVLILDIFPENGMKDFAAILEESGTRGFAGARLSNFCYVECVDFRAMRGFDECRQQLEEFRQRETASWMEREDLVIDMSSFEILAFTPNAAPFTVFPIPSRLCMDILTGAKSYISYLNLSALGRELERAGWFIEKGPLELMTNEADVNTPIFIVRKEGAHFHIPSADLMRLQMEFLRPQVLIKQIEMIRQLGPLKAPRAALAEYQHEAQIWN